MQKLKVGLIVDGLYVSKAVRDLIEWSKLSPDLEISHLIIQHVVKAKRSRITRLVDRLRRRGLGDVLGALVIELVTRVERRPLLLRKGANEYLKHHDISSTVDGSINVRPNISKSGLVFRYEKSDLDAICSESFDVLIRCGSGILRGPILEAARLGVISFHHGDNRVYRGGPAGFWEVLHRAEQTGFIIQKLTEDLDAGEVLLRGGFPTQHFFSLNQMFVIEQSSPYLYNLLTRMAKSGSLPAIQNTDARLGPIFKSPGLFDALWYVGKLIWLYLARIRRRILNLNPQWVVRVTSGSPLESSPVELSSLPVRPDRYLADPCLIERDGQTVCFVEEYLYATKRGRIVSYEIRGSTVGQRLVCLEEAFHLSFPYVFEYQGTLFMCPETIACKEIRLYRCDGFPGKWQYFATLMSEISAADTMIFEKNGLWWMMTNIDRSGMGDHSSELSIFFASSPTSTQWTPHAMNPVIIDSTCARNGGLILNQRGIYRAGQRQGFDAYGISVTLNEITVLSPDLYAEVPVRVIEPDHRQREIGSHHISATSEFWVRDALVMARTSRRGSRD
ncbi:MAG: hypothetical protein HQ486_00145 [Acidimicrobiaceae bacterium]|nr:hypothetical protein [Acidimicrobiaceae bacterium]